MLPIVLIGGYFGSFIKAKIFDIKFIASSLILGGVIMVFIEKLLPKSDIKKIDQIGLKKSFYIGLFQVFALIPGMSRAGSSIIGAMILGVDRLTAAKFSFFWLYQQFVLQRFMIFIKIIIILYLMIF